MIRCDRSCTCCSNKKVYLSVIFYDQGLGLVDKFYIYFIELKISTHFVLKIYFS